MTGYRASITSTEVWLRILNTEHGDDLVDVAPFWAQRPAAITFTAGGHTVALPALACRGPDELAGCVSGAQRPR